MERPSSPDARTVSAAGFGGKFGGPFSGPHGDAGHVAARKTCFRHIVSPTCVIDRMGSGVRRFLTVLVFMGVVQSAAADDPRWVTFKSGRNDWGLIQHQIDRQTIRHEGPSTWTFWSRMWRAEKKEPLVASYYGSLIFWSQKFAVDCTG